MLKLFYAPGACSLAPHIVLEEIGGPHTLERVNLRDGAQRAPAYLAINPKGRVPALATDRGILTENPAILAYLAQTHPQAKLAPLEDAFLFAKMQGFNMFLCATVHVAFAHAFRPERYADGAAAAQAMRAKAPQALAHAFGLVEETLADDRPYVLGDQYSVADAYLSVFSRWLSSRGLGSLEDFPKTGAHLARISERPAVIRALAVEAQG
jgi:glutathione S-transferase